MAYTILGKEVGNIGYGLMGLQRLPPSVSDDEKVEIMKTALTLGCNVWNGGEFYGPSLEKNSLTLLKTYFDKYPEDAAKVSINIKGGAHLPLTCDNDPVFTRQSLQNCIDTIGPDAKIDMWEMARRISQEPYLQSIRVMDEFVKAGKIAGVALSEVNAKTIRQVAELGVKIAAVEIEISLWETEALTNGVCATCAELGIPIMAYSPIGRGFLAGKWKCFEDIPKDKYVRLLPRFQPENFDNNLKLVEQVEKLAAKKGCTPANIAINWVAALSRRPGMPKIIPIPGSSSLERVKENTREVELTDDDLKEIDEMLEKCTVIGDRYHPHGMNQLDKTE